MSQIGTSALAKALERQAISIRAGLDLRSIWEKEMQRSSPTYRKNAAIVHQRIAAGDALVEALDACGDYFPKLVRDLTDVGEKTGLLDQVLSGLADHYKHLLSLRRTFLIGIAWPSIQLFVALGVIGLLIYVLGMIPAGANGEPIDILGFGLTGGSGLVVYVFLVCSFFGALALAVVGLLRGWFGTRPLQLAMQVPVIGGYLRTSALSRFAWTLSLSLDSGLDARRAMELALRSTQNPFYTSQMEAVDESLALGKEFHESLRITDMFPDDFLHSLETAEISGTHGETLGRIAEEYRSKATTAATALTMAATVAVWVTVFGFIIFMIFRLAAFYIGTINNALQGF